MELENGVHKKVCLLIRKNSLAFGDLFRDTRSFRGIKYRKNPERI